MKLSRVGEFGLIDRIKKIVTSDSKNLLLGIGDDAALFRSRPGWITILTTDAMVEGIHFDLTYTPIESLGWKALAINLSDVAAMGGVPQYAVVSLAVPSNWEVEDVELFYRGMKQCGDFYGCMLIGGDTVSSNSGCFISVTVVGEVEDGLAVTRNGATNEDVLCVTGKLGGSMVGLEVLRSGENKNRFPISVKRFLEPGVKLRESRELVREFKITSMIDISDGLSSEILHICQESNLGCLIEEDKIPVAEEVFLWAEKSGKSYSTYALNSGEEYELLFTMPKVEYEKFLSKKSDVAKFDFTVIGEMKPKSEGIKIMRQGSTVPLSPEGWNHFENIEKGRQNYFS